MKKIMTILATAMVALMLVGCAKFGDVQTSGTKWKKTFNLDGTKSTVHSGEYSRGFSALSSSTKCYEIETTISVPMGTNPENIVVSGDNKSVIGLAFDVHVTKNAQNKDVYDFVLVGVKPSDGGYYVEHYTGVLKEKLKEDMITNEPTIGGTYTEVAAETNGWAGTVAVNNAGTNVNEVGYQWTIKVTQQTPGTYKILINGQEKATYTRALTSAESSSNEGKAYGQIFTYGNAPYGTKIKAVFESNKDTTHGLFADEEEF